MANSYFQFKQFTIQQEGCAMKVTTDGCLFGAFSADWLLMQIAAKPANQASFDILDIGSGTGLLALMLAQKNPAVQIEAVEIDMSAAHQSQHNFDASPWKNNLTVHHSPIQDFALSIKKKYNIIISNPPFYERQLNADDHLKNTAHHSAALNLKELFFSVKQLMYPNGYFIVLLPFYRTDEAISTAENHHLFLQQKILLKQTPKHHYFRSILIFSLVKTENLPEEIITIKDAQHQYTPRFQQLLADYYLYF